jgi:5-methylcytosine-specific restriction endonuclease McrA
MDPGTRRRVLRRDRWRCTMPVCLHPPGQGGRTITRGLPHDDPWAGTADHVIPVTYGGSDAMENLRAAHRICNQHRGAGGHVTISTPSGQETGQS